MIAIKFSPKFEDRVSIFLKNSKIKDLGVSYDFKETPNAEPEYFCYWLFDYNHRKHVNLILSTFQEMISIMGVDDLQFQYVSSEKEFYVQYQTEYHSSIPWCKLCA